MKKLETLTRQLFTCFLFFLNPKNRLLQKPNKRPDVVQTFDYLAEMRLWTGNSNGFHGSHEQRKNDLQNQLTQVTDELNQLKSQLTSAKIATRSSKTEHQLTFECGSFNSQSSNSSTCVTNFDEHVVSTATEASLETVGCLTENDDKDRQISLLTTKLNESDKEANELRQEVARLRSIIKQRNG